MRHPVHLRSKHPVHFIPRTCLWERLAIFVDVNDGVGVVPPDLSIQRLLKVRSDILSPSDLKMAKLFLVLHNIVTPSNDPGITKHLDFSAPAPASTH